MRQICPKRIFHVQSRIITFGNNFHLKQKTFLFGPNSAKSVTPAQNRRIRHIRIILGIKLFLKKQLWFLDQIYSKKCFPSKAVQLNLTIEFNVFELVYGPSFILNQNACKIEKSELHHRIQHIWISLDTKSHLHPIQDGNFWGCSRMGGGQKGPLPKICHRYPTMMKLGTIIIYLKQIPKNYESRDTPPDFCWHQYFFTGNQ